MTDDGKRTTVKLSIIDMESQRSNTQRHAS
jgi:hypothetical protein